MGLVILCIFIFCRVAILALALATRQLILRKSKPGSSVDRFVVAPSLCFLPFLPIVTPSPGLPWIVSPRFPRCTSLPPFVLFITPAYAIFGSIGSNIALIMSGFAAAIPEPTVAELSSFVEGTLELVVETTGFVGDYSDPETVPGSLFVLLAGNAADILDMSMSNVAGISYEEFEAILQEWCPPISCATNMAASVLLKSRARRLLKACKLVLGLEWTVAATEQYNLDCESNALEAYRAATALAPAVTVAVVNETRTVKMSEIADVARSDDVAIISKARVDDGIKFYTKLMHVRRNQMKTQLRNNLIRATWTWAFGGLMETALNVP